MMADVVNERAFVAVPEYRARLAKATALVDGIRALRIPAVAVASYGDEQWQMLAQLADVHEPSEATIAGVNPPSPTTRDLVREWVAATDVEHSPPPDDPEAT